MKRCLVLCLSILALFTAPAFATEWTGTQVMFTVEGTKPITETVSWSGTACRFEVPKTSTVMWFAYTGPTFTVSDWLWASPQIGYSGGWVDGEDSFITAGWADITLKPGVVLSLDGEDIATAGSHDTYWYNQANVSKGALNAGLHWESTNDFHQWGPHVGVKQGPWKGELRYFTGEGAHTVRLAVKLGF